MKRLVYSSEFRAEFPGIRTMYHDKSAFDDRVEIRMSYKTALLFIDGQHVTSFYPSKSHTPAYWVDDIMGYCADYGVPISEGKAYELADFMIRTVR